MFDCVLPGAPIVLPLLLVVAPARFAPSWVLLFVVVPAIVVAPAIIIVAPAIVVAPARFALVPASCHRPATAARRRLATVVPAAPAVIVLPLLVAAARFAPATVASR